MPLLLTCTNWAMSVTLDPFLQDTRVPMRWRMCESVLVSSSLTLDRWLYTQHQQQSIRSTQTFYWLYKITQVQLQISLPHTHISKNRQTAQKLLLSLNTVQRTIYSLVMVSRESQQTPFWCVQPWAASSWRVLETRPLLPPTWWAGEEGQCPHKSETE